MISVRKHPEFRCRFLSVNRCLLTVNRRLSTVNRCLLRRKEKKRKENFTHLALVIASLMAKKTDAESKRGGSPTP